MSLEHLSELEGFVSGIWTEFSVSILNVHDANPFLILCF